MPRILVVDDSPTEVFRFKEMLNKYGYEVIEAMSGEEGIQMAKSILPDLILMDMVFKLHAKLLVIISQIIFRLLLLALKTKKQIEFGGKDKVLLIT